jgi:uncharacterized membrane protein (UPF0127 family)
MIVHEVDVPTTPRPQPRRHPGPGRGRRLLAGVALALATASAAPAAAQHAGPTARAEAVFPDKTVVSLEVARTEPERSRGLMHRASMPERSGMIFLFDRPGLYPFWMKDTLIPLDLFWTDTTGTIVWIAESVPPCRNDPCPEYPPKAVAQYVIETNAGFARRHAVKVGDVITLRKLPR